MIRDPRKVEELEAADARRQQRSFADALAVFTGLWNHACALRPDFARDWQHDLEPDFAIARAVNGLPPRA